MAKLVPLVIKVEGLPQLAERLANAEAEAWEAGMRHSLAWLGLKQYGDVMAKDNPHTPKQEPFRPTGFPPRPLRKDKVG